MVFQTLIRFIYYIYNYRLLYYLHMERMKKPKFIKEIEKSEWKERAKCWRWYIRVYWELDHKPMVELESLEIVVKELHKLEEENKKLKKERDLYKARNEELNEDCFWLAKENKKLNIKVASLEWEIKWLNSVIDKLKEENQTLELWLDRKEKLNEKYRKEIEKLKSTYVYDAKQVRDIC